MQKICKNIFTMSKIQLDTVDKRIISALQQDARMTFDQLAEWVQLSPSAVLRRVRKLEELGVVRGYRAQVEPEAVGLALTAYLNVRITRQSEGMNRTPVESFHAAVATWPEVVSCASLTGDMDYLLCVMVQDMAHYSRFLMGTLLKHPSVMDCKTSFVMNWVKRDQGVRV